MPLLPVALYGLEVPAGNILVPAVADFPATFRITMAAIDPSATPQTNDDNPSAPPRATLKLVRVAEDPEDDESEDEDGDEYLKALLAGGSDSDDDSEEDSEDEDVNGGPSDPAKSKKAQKAAAINQLIASIKKGEDSDDDMEDAPANGLSAKAKGKAKATEGDEEEDESEDGEDLDVEEFVICTLDPEKTYQQTLDITIAEGESVFFKVTGTHTIYLTGNYVVPDDNGHNHHHEVYDSEDESEDDEDYDLSPSEDELELQLDGEESDELDDLNDPRITELQSDDDEAPKLVSKADKKGKNKRSADALEEAESLDDLVSKSLKPEAAKSEEAPKLSKKQLKKLKNNKGDAVEVKAAEEVKESGKGDKKVQFAKNLEQGPTGSTPEKAAVNGKPKATVGVKEVNGVKIDDKKIGTGPAAKNNNRVEMRYIGKFADGKVFDSNKKGKPFAFKLGKGEVIKGWDIGVAGMQVGGERRLTIPGNLAYGSSPPPGIPKNATLIFDIKLLNIK